MKRFIANVALMCILVAAGLVALAAVNRFYLGKDNYLFEFPVKQQLIKDTPSPKIVLLGGSSVAFGFDCKTMSDSLHLPVINAGLHAGLGLRFIMDNNVNLLRQGDILVVMPEYNHFTGNACGDSHSLGQIPYFATLDELLGLNLQQGLNVAKGFGHITTTFFVEGCKSLLRRKDGDTYEYSMYGFNGLGDEVSHLSLKPDVDMQTFPLPNMDGDLDREYIDEFSGQVRSLQHRGIKVILLPPVIYDVYYNISRTAIQTVTNALAAEGIPFQASPESFVYPIDCMYNTEYHLNRKGVTLNTQKVIRALRAL